jgi:hypothetical protein
MTPFQSFFNFFLSKKGIFVTLYTQNDVVLNFSSIFTVSINRGDYFIRSW